tara:strand:+ start:28 stop:219 length:192 start_codon:yes stop_codon:yes gene_type:complete
MNNHTIKLIVAFFAGYIAAKMLLVRVEGYNPFYAEEWAAKQTGVDNLVKKVTRGNRIMPRDLF